MTGPNRRINQATYRVLPPKWRVIYSESSQPLTAERYIRQFDQGVPYSPPGRLPDDQYRDLVSHVFANQLAQHAVNSYQTARLIVDRQTIAQKHLADIDWRLDELQDRRPLRLAALDDFKLTDVEKQINDLEKQKRQSQVAMWRDVLELRQGLAEARREYRATRDRMLYLGGGLDGRQ